MSVNFNDPPGPTSAHRVVTGQQLRCKRVSVRTRQMFGCQRLLASGRKRYSALNYISSRLSGTSLVIFLHRVESELRPLTFIVALLASLSKHTTMLFFSSSFFFFFLLNIMLQLRVHAWEAVAVLAAARMEANRGKEAELD